MKSDVKEFDTYEIQRRGIISDFDQKVLFRLYQPIIGHSATCLYLTLLCETKLSTFVSKNLTHKRLFAMMQISNEEFINARIKLESIGLLNTKIKGNKDGITLAYLYSLQSPKAPNDFFNDSLLSGLLLKSLGEDEFFRTQYSYLNNQYEDDDYIDITSTFEDSFIPSSAKPVNLTNQFSKKSTQNVISNFNMDAFVIKMTEHLIPKSLFTIAVKNEILRVKILFDLSEEILEKSVLSAIEVDHNNKKSINLIEFNQIAEDLNRETEEDEIDDLYLFAKHLDETDSYDYYRELLEIPALFKDDIYLIKSLLEMNIPNGIINSALYYCFTYKKGDYNFKNYVNKVVGSIIKEKCKNAYQALTYLKKRSSGRMDDRKPTITNKVEPKSQKIENEDDVLDKILSVWGK